MTRIFLNPTPNQTKISEIPNYLNNFSPIRISSGLDDLDKDFGGIPLGKITEIFGHESSGKTLFALKLVRQAIKNGNNVLYIDSDQTLMTNEFQDNPNFVLSRLNEAEKVFQLVLQAIQSKVFSLIIIDTLSALISPRDNCIQDKSLSQLLSDYMPDFEHELNTCPNTGLIFLQRNVFMNGCLHGNTLIPFTNGKVYPISHVVEKQLRGKVYSIDEKGNVQANEIQDWHNHGSVNDDCPFMFISARHDNGWQSRVFLTENHPIHLSDKAWTPVKDIKEGDVISGRYINFLNKENKEFLRGCLLGAAYFHFNREHKKLELFLSSRQGTPLSLDTDYMRFKAQKLSCYDFKERKSHNGKYWVSSFSYSDDFYRMRDEKEIYNKSNNKRSNKFSFYENLSDREIALWFADCGEVDYTEDGWSFSVPLPTKNEYEACKYVRRVQDSGYPVYVWGVLSETDELLEFRMAFKDETPLRLMMMYIPSDILHRYFGEALNYFNIGSKGNISHLPLMSHPVVHKGDFTVLSVQKMSDVQVKRNPNRYDLTIKRHSNYLAGGLGGIFVHNSPSNHLSMASHSRISVNSDGKNGVTCSIVKDKDVPPNGKTYLLK